jgi:hypothetical protein
VCCEGLTEIVQVPVRLVPLAKRCCEVVKVSGAPRRVAAGAGGCIPEIRGRLVKVRGCLADLIAVGERSAEVAADLGQLGRVRWRCPGRLLVDVDRFVQVG